MLFDQFSVADRDTIAFVSVDFIARNFEAAKGITAQAIEGAIRPDRMLRNAEVAFALYFDYILLAILVNDIGGPY